MSTRAFILRGLFYCTNCITCADTQPQNIGIVCHECAQLMVFLGHYIHSVFTSTLQKSWLHCVAYCYLHLYITVMCILLPFFGARLSASLRPEFTCSSGYPRYIGSHVCLAQIWSPGHLYRNVTSAHTCVHAGCGVLGCKHGCPGPCRPFCP